MTHETEERRHGMEEVLTKLDVLNKRMGDAELQLALGKDKMEHTDKVLTRHADHISQNNALLKLSLENDAKILAAIYGGRIKTLLVRFGILLTTLGTAFFNWWKK